MWKESDSKLVVRIGRSPTLCVLLVLMHLGAWGGILIVPLPWYAKVLPVILVGFSLRTALAAHALRDGSGAVVEVELRENDWSVHMIGTSAWVAASVAGAFVHPWLVALRLRLDGKRWPLSVIILRGAADPDAFRELRVRLNGRAPPSKDAVS